MHSKTWAYARSQTKSHEMHMKSLVFLGSKKTVAKLEGNWPSTYLKARKYLSVCNFYLTVVVSKYREMVKCISQRNFPFCVGSIHSKLNQFSPVVCILPESAHSARYLSITCLHKNR